MPEYKLTYDGDLNDIERAVWCAQCGDQLFFGNPYYIYEDDIYCPHCAQENDIIYDGIEVDCTL